MFACMQASMCVCERECYCVDQASMALSELLL